MVRSVCLFLLFQLGVCFVAHGAVTPRRFDSLDTSRLYAEPPRRAKMGGSDSRSEGAMSFRSRLIDKMEPITISGLNQEKVSAIVAGMQYAYMKGAENALLLAAEDADVRGSPERPGMDYLSAKQLRTRASEIQP